MKLIIVSGRSGSGKSTVLHVLEDLGFYCIDNLPIGLLFPLTREATTHASPGRLDKIAVSIDARNLSGEIANFEGIYQQLQQSGLKLEIIFLDATDQALLQRFHATRRKHPLSDEKTSLREAITYEKLLLEPLARLADLHVDTTDVSMYELRDMVKQRVAGRREQELALLFQSFGFKHGVPVDSDYVFDVRCLPNPYWDTSLRRFTGLDSAVAEFLESEPATRKMINDLIGFLETWLPDFAKNNRSYMTISIGCTGGQHRSVYACDQLGKYFSQQYNNVQVRHSELLHIKPAES
ncbi:RNase adapter RapZ [Marinobacter caseinilyticus]|uniref:RNase adapter RapZ n=1 Tax=Marinobacter caseinilyticus TaxID=2692195 RepID=UPI00140E0ACC|nr:RNase adapter RapZ [Marinobacter caseinilyticus]